MSELYREAAGLLQKLERREGGLKSLAFSDDVAHKRSSLKLVCETLRYKPLLAQVLEAVPACQSLTKKQPMESITYISLYDLLFGQKKKIQGGGYVKKELTKHVNALREALVRMKIKAKVATAEELLPETHRHGLQGGAKLPRYARVNTLLISDDELSAFKQDYPFENDAHVKDLIVLPPGTDLHDHSLVKTGKLVLQDKASCFPAFVLHGERSDLNDAGDVIDACAAPGNKTSHVAMLLAQKGESYKDRKVFAFDRSPKRLDLLEQRMEEAGATSRVEPCLQSFLEIDVHDAKYANVRSILLDPSCSGSGMTNRFDHLLDIASADSSKSKGVEEYEADGVESRVEALAQFQLQALLKAFSFPQVERVAYSTCSIFTKEDEEVVAAALSSAANRDMTRPFKLQPCLESWSRRGKEVEGLSAEEAAKVVRADGHEDLTNGFFVAYFERASTSTTGQSKEATSGKKRKHLSESQKENRKRRKREKRKQKK